MKTYSIQMQPLVIEPSFSSRFFDDYAKKVIRNPHIAITEIVANSWDAGATRVEIEWPNQETGGIISVKDDGIGMTYEEFVSYWGEASYNRIKSQGDIIETKNGVVRKVYGRNGIGRFGMFCFSNEYEVSTWKNGIINTFSVTRDSKPFHMTHKSKGKKTGSGTVVSCERTLLSSILVTPDTVTEWLQTKFFNTSDFEIILNGKTIELGICEKISEKEVTLSSGKTITLTRYKLHKGLKKNNGILFRVNGRAVGEPGWAILKNLIKPSQDGVSNLLITVDVDFLEDYVEPDWTSFKKNPIVEKTTEEITDAIEAFISDVVMNARLGRKKTAIKKNLPELRKMSEIEHVDLDKALQWVVDNCPAMTENDLVKILTALVIMEKSNSKYALMEKLSNVCPDDIDNLNEILAEWSIADARMVLREISQRIKVLDEMEKIVNNKETLEVKVLQPLIGSNLWIFGPEFDSCAFTSNKTITTAMKELFKAEIDENSRRPDFVILPTGTMGAYCADHYDYDFSNGESRGFSKIVIVELKRGGYKIGFDEMNQAKKYANALKQTGKIPGNPKYTCYVVGSTLESGIEPERMESGSIVTFPVQYDMLINAADARLLGIRKRIEDSFGPFTDLKNDISEIIKEYPRLDDILP